MTALAILDLGYGNIRSVALAFQRLGQQPVVTDDPRIARDADRLVVPGVGAAAAAMARLSQAGLADVIRGRTRPTLGICLGMQLLFDRSEEDGGVDLLSILPGTVRALVAEPNFPVPHMGWSRIDTAAAGSGLSGGDYVYFAHSFRCPDAEGVAATTRYGAVRIPAAIRSGDYWGAQFHPERSSAAGAAFLEAFVRS